MFITFFILVLIFLAFHFYAEGKLQHIEVSDEIAYESRPWQRIIHFCVFLQGFLMLAAIKGRYQHRIIKSFDFDKLDFYNSYPEGFRILDRILMTINHEVFELFFKLAENKTAFPKLLFLGNYFFLLCLLLVVFLILEKTYSSFLARLAGMFFFFFIFMGEGKLTRHHTFFFITYDYFAIFFIFAFYYLLQRNKEIPLWQNILFLIIAQSSFEHLGPIWGGSYCFFHYIIQRKGKDLKERLQVFFPRVAILGLVSVTFLFGLYQLLELINDKPAVWGGEGTSIKDLHSYYGKYNNSRYSWLPNDLVMKDVYSVIKSPIIIGVIIGLFEFIFFRAKVNFTKLKNEVHASGTIVLIFFFVLFAVGTYISGLRAELGRQSMPLLLILPVYFYKLTLLVLGQWKNLIAKKVVATPVTGPVEEKPLAKNKNKKKKGKK